MKNEVVEGLKNDILHLKSFLNSRYINEDLQKEHLNVVLDYTKHKNYTTIEILIATDGDMYPFVKKEYNVEDFKIAKGMLDNIKDNYMDNITFKCYKREVVEDNLTIYSIKSKANSTLYYLVHNKDFKLLPKDFNGTAIGDINDNDDVMVEFLKNFFDDNDDVKEK